MCWHVDIYLCLFHEKRIKSLTSSWSSYSFRMLEIILKIAFISNAGWNNSLVVMANQLRIFFNHDILHFPTLLLPLIFSVLSVARVHIFGYSSLYDPGILISVFLVISNYFIFCNFWSTLSLNNRSVHGIFLEPLTGLF